MTYTLILNGGHVETFNNLSGILNYFRSETYGETMYVDDTEISPEDLVEHAVDMNDVVTVECGALCERGDDYVDIVIAADE